MKTAKTEALIKKAGGFIGGVCEPWGNVDGNLLLGANLHWIRTNVPYPFDEKGNLTDWYQSYKKMCADYLNMGIGTMAITPYPGDYLRLGIDPRMPEGAAEVERVCEYIAQDLKDCVNLWQAGNEMMYLVFRTPLTDAEARDFLIHSIKGLKKGNPEAFVGHNSFCPTSDGEELCTCWLQNDLDIEAAVGGCDYTGLDYYGGTWSPGGVESYEREINRAAELIGLPVILAEFGFISDAEVTEDPNAEMLKYLNSIGFADYEDMDRRMDEFVALMPEPMRKACENADFKTKRTYIHSNKWHFFKKIPRTSDIPHTEEGQAEFYRRILNLLLNNENTAGFFLFNIKDNSECWHCGAPDCPCEGHIGLIRTDGTPKPAYQTICEMLQQNS